MPNGGLPHEVPGATAMAPQQMMQQMPVQHQVPVQHLEQTMMPEVAKQVETAPAAAEHQPKQGDAAPLANGNSKAHAEAMLEHTGELGGDVDVNGEDGKPSEPLSFAEILRRKQNRAAPAAQAGLDAHLPEQQEEAQEVQGNTAPQAPAGKDDVHDGCSVFVRNLPANVTEEMLAKELGAYGALKGGAESINLKTQKVCKCHYEVECA